jgi:hypothetical protein
MLIDSLRGPAPSTAPGVTGYSDPRSLPFILSEACTRRPDYKVSNPPLPDAASHRVANHKSTSNVPHGQSLIFLSFSRIRRTAGRGGGAIAMGFSFSRDIFTCIHHGSATTAEGCRKHRWHTTHTHTSPSPLPPSFRGLRWRINAAAMQERVRVRAPCLCHHPCLFVFPPDLATGDIQVTCHKGSEHGARCQRRGQSCRRRRMSCQALGQRPRAVNLSHWALFPVVVAGKPKQPRTTIRSLGPISSCPLPTHRSFKRKLHVAFHRCGPKVNLIWVRNLALDKVPLWCWWQL